MDSRLRWNDEDLAEVYHLDMYGKRQAKYETLINNTLASLPFKNLKYRKPEYFFVPKNFEVQEKYDKGFSIIELFSIHSNGFTTERDAVALQFDHDCLDTIIQDIKELEDTEFRAKYNVSKDGSEWKLRTAKEDLLTNEVWFGESLYRPFDFRFTCYTGKSKGFFARPRGDVLKHMIRQNIALIAPKQEAENGCAFITNKIAGHKSFSAYNKNNVFPLYIFLKSGKQQVLDESTERKPNLDAAIVEANHTENHQNQPRL